MRVSKVGKVLAVVMMLSPLFPIAAEARWESDSDINNYRQQLQDRIELGQTWGALTPTETTHLQNDLRKLKKLEERASHYGLTAREKQSIWKELEKLDANITAELKDNDKVGWHRNWDRNHDGMTYWQHHHKKFDRDAFQKSLRTISDKITSGIASGQLNRDESKYLHDEANRLQSVLNESQKGGMTADEVTSFERMLEKFDERLNRALHSVATGKWNSGNWHHGWKSSKHPVVPNLSSPPQWDATKGGGYHDLTGQIAGTIPANELYRYGGTMKDGRPAPTTPHVNVNTSGHIAW